MWSQQPRIEPNMVWGTSCPPFLSQNNTDPSLSANKLPTKAPMKEKGDTVFSLPLCLINLALVPGDGPNDIKAWRLKLLAWKMLGPNFDGRKLTGLQNKYEKLMKSKKPMEKMSATILKNCHSLLAQLRALAKGNIQSMELQDLESKLQLVNDEGIEFPVPLMKD